MPAQHENSTASSPVRERPVQVLWITSLISMFGNTLTAIAVPWFVLETTGSASRTGVTAAVVIVPVIIASFLGGAIVDRTSHRLLSVSSDAMSAITVAAVPLFYFTTGLSFPGLLALMFLGAMFDAPGSTARQAMIPELSRWSGISLERINANFGMIRAATALFSAPFAGLMIAWLGPVNVLWFNAATFLISALAVWTFIPRLNPPAASGESFMGDVREGFAYVRNNALLRTLIFGAVAINFLLAPLFGVAIPFVANQEFHSVKALGIMMGGEGVGTLIGAFLYGRLSARLSRHTFLKLALLLLAAPVLPLAFSTSLWTSAALLIAIGLGSGLVNPMLSTFLQVTTPETMLGRVTGLVMAGAMIAQPAGLLLGGVGIGLIGFQGSVVSIGVLIILVGAVLALSPILRGLDGFQEPQPETPEPSDPLPRRQPV